MLRDQTRGVGSIKLLPRNKKAIKAPKRSARARAQIPKKKKRKKKEEKKKEKKKKKKKKEKGKSEKKEKKKGTRPACAYTDKIKNTKK